MCVFLSKIILTDSNLFFYLYAFLGNPQLLIITPDLPSGTKQTIIIDVRGQQVTNDVLRQIRTSILEKCNTDVLIQFMR